MCINIKYQNHNKANKAKAAAPKERRTELFYLLFFYYSYSEDSPTVKLASPLIL